MSELVQPAPSPVGAVDVVKLIKVVEVRGNGTPQSPKRTVVSYWNMEGERLWTDDPTVGTEVQS